MTDFIHEPERKPDPARKSAYTPPKTEKEGMRRVYLYSAVLLCAALALMALSFFSNNRSNQELRDQLGTIQGALEKSADQRAKIDELRKQNEMLQKNVESAVTERETHRFQLCALDWLRDIESTYASGDEDGARELIRRFENTSLTPYLSEMPLHTPPAGEGEAPSAVYARIVAELFPDGVN